VTSVGVLSDLMAQSSLTSASAAVTARGDPVLPRIRTSLSPVAAEAPSG
jgi:hypothetical protein